MINRIKEIILFSAFDRLPFKLVAMLCFLWMSITGRMGASYIFIRYFERDLEAGVRWLNSPVIRFLFKPLVEVYTAWSTLRLLVRAIQRGPADTQDAIAKSKDVQLLIEGTQYVLEHRDFQYLDHNKIQNIDGTEKDLSCEEYVRKFFATLPGCKPLLEHLRQDCSQVPNVATPTLSQMYYMYRNLILRTYHAGQGHLVPDIYRRSVALQKHLRRHMPTISPAFQKLLDGLQIDLPNLKLFAPDWCGLIGHMGHMDIHLRMREMGWWKGSPLMFTYDRRIANRVFLSLFAPQCPTVILGETITPELLAEICALQPYFGVSHQAWCDDDGNACYWNDAGSRALKQWQDMGLGYPLRDVYDRTYRLADETQAAFQSFREAFGMKPGDWFVCLHMREASARGEINGVGETVRNAELEDYLDAVRYITSRGGWVVRMGASSVSPFPKMERVIDYARSAHRSALMDIHLVREAAFFIGTTSGFAYVASSFGVPSALVNCISSIGLLWTNNSRFALKPVRTAEGRLLTQSEVVSEKYRWAYPTYESLSRAGLKLSCSSADEILETVKEVADIALGTSTPYDASLRARWEASLGMPEFFGASLPSRYFLDKYGSKFLPD